MKTFKYIDAWVSTTLIAGYLLFGLFSRFHTATILGYFVVGGWQVISMIVHAAGKWFNERGGARNHYHWIVCILLAIWMISFTYIPFLLIICYVMVFAGPIMAIYYTSICFGELKAMNRRPLAILK